tara:strand:- start:57 stop:368 length:312 start_codon:yes stop_codon:yes gene_type:complete
MPARRPTKKFTRALSSYVDLRAKQKALDEEMAEIKATLLQCAADAGGKIITLTHTVQQIETERKTLQKDKLLEQGVTPKQISKATKITPVVYVKVSEKKLEAA